MVMKLSSAYSLHLVSCELMMGSSKNNLFFNGDEVKTLLKA